MNNVYRYRGASSTSTNGIRYQTQKLIQKTVRVPESVYTMCLGASTVYQAPDKNYTMIDATGSPYIAPPSVNWNQMSDRRQPHKQTLVTSSGSTYGGNSLRRSLVRMRPGCMSPGGSGCDIKHNSYDRYLNRIKGKTPLKRGVIPVTFDKPFNPAYPFYGNKQMKLGIINGCNCVDQPEDKLYTDECNYNLMEHDFEPPVYTVGQEVWALEDFVWRKAIITDVFGSMVEVQFEDGRIEIKDIYSIRIYYDCSGCNVDVDKGSNLVIPYTGSDNQSLFCNVVLATQEQ